MNSSSLSDIPCSQLLPHLARLRKRVLANFDADTPNALRDKEALDRTHADDSGHRKRAFWRSRRLLELRSLYTKRVRSGSDNDCETALVSHLKLLKPANAEQAQWIQELFEMLEEEGAQYNQSTLISRLFQQNSGSSVGQQQSVYENGSTRLALLLFLMAPTSDATASMTCLTTSFYICCRVCQTIFLQVLGQGIFAERNA